MSKKATIILCTVLVLLVALFCAARLVLVPEPEPGQKHILFEVCHSDGSIFSAEIDTNAETLAEALMEQKLIDAEEGPYGLWVTAVDGEYADEGRKQYWIFYKDGTALNTGVSDTLISDGEYYEARIVQY